MSQTSSTQNLNAHYTNNPKVIRTKNRIANAPVNLPKHHLYSDIDANDRMKNLNNDIYQSYKNEKNKSGITFLKIFGVLAALVVGIKGIKKLASFFKKS